ncbi:MAG: hypothetical protein ACREME_06745, partial [Gemmatimonadales bacterium]
MRRLVWLACALAGTAGCADIATPSRTPRNDPSDPVNPGEIFRWPASRIPVRYFVDDRGTLPALVARGLRIWERQFLYGEFRGVIVSDSTAADVIVRWQDSVPPDVPPDTSGAVGACGGVTSYLIDSTNTITDPLRVLVRPNLGYTLAQVAACLPRVTAHELGHSLGILSHAAGTGELMHG